MKILIAEDEVYSRKSIVKQIKAMDTEDEFIVFEAADGKEALEIVNREEPELVLSDIKMPFMDGIQLLSEISSTKPHIKTIIISGYADFQYAKEALKLGAIGYILKPVKDSEIEEYLKKFLKEKQKIQKDEEYKNIFNNKDNFSKFIYKKAMNLNPSNDFVNKKLFQRVFSEYRLIKIYFKDYMDLDKRMLYNNVKNTADSIEDCEIRMINIGDKSFLIVVREDSQTRFFIEKISKTLAENQIDYYIGVSKKQNDVEKLNEAQNQTSLCVKSKLFYETRILYFDAVSSERYENLLNLDDRIRSLKLCIEKLDKKQADIQLKALTDVFFKNSNLSIECMENSLFKVLNMLHELMLSCGSSEENKGFNSAGINLYDFDRRKDLDEFIAKVAEKTIDCLKKSSNAENDTVHQILKYIDENYDQNLSLKELSEKVFFMNNTYLSHLISESTGKSYSNYLKEVRINKAKEYLRNESFTITEVCTLCGYNDASQFIQVFKKETGMTPKKYREKHIETKEMLT